MSHDQIGPLYLEALTMVERLHRRLKDEFDRCSRADINSVQALLLYGCAVASHRTACPG
jgi:hypothetical protein